MKKPTKQELEQIQNNIRSVCQKCEGKGWYFVNEWIGTIQGRKDCICNGKLPS